ncbi:hypothetical protein E2C01_018664 [Portunus trituberculatus]|uniref:Uncharacterized protein n=1 Tax=Portunus trituberculatus TaxID=210409 RepID=A0A5B7DX29_PORTR|nr:hypothetical protein [Portunus trituberculatus]
MGVAAFNRGCSGNTLIRVRGLTAGEAGRPGISGVVYLRPLGWGLAGIKGKVRSVAQLSSSYLPPHLGRSSTLLLVIHRQAGQSDSIKARMWLAAACRGALQQEISRRLHSRLFFR